MEDLTRMTYLEWCIKETMRLYPSVPWFGRAISEDTEFGKYYNYGCKIIHTPQSKLVQKEKMKKQF